MFLDYLVLLKNNTQLNLINDSIENLNGLSSQIKLAIDKMAEKTLEPCVFKEVEKKQDYIIIEKLIKKIINSFIVTPNEELDEEKNIVCFFTILEKWYAAIKKVTNDDVENLNLFSINRQYSDESIDLYLYKEEDVSVCAMSFQSEGGFIYKDLSTIINYYRNDFKDYIVSACKVNYKKLFLDEKRKNILTMNNVNFFVIKKIESL